MRLSEEIKFKINGTPYEIKIDRVRWQIGRHIPSYKSRAILKEAESGKVLDWDCSIEKGSLSEDLRFILFEAIFGIKKKWRSLRKRLLPDQVKD